MFPTYWNEIDNLWLEKIREDWFNLFKNTIDIYEEGEGNRVIDKKFYFSCWAGPAADLFDLFHEMSHFIEIDDRRCSKTPDWGFKYGKTIYIPNYGSVNEGMVTTKAIEREIRVFGIQLHLIELYKLQGNKYNSKYMAKLCEHIDGFYGFYPKNPNYKYDTKNIKAFQKIEKLIQKEYQNWTIEKIYNEWVRKIKILKKRLK